MVASIKAIGPCGCSRDATHRNAGVLRCENCRRIEDSQIHSHRHWESTYAARAKEATVRQRGHVTTATRRGICGACDLWLDAHGIPRDTFTMNATHGAAI